MIKSNQDHTPSNITSNKRTKPKVSTARKKRKLSLCSLKWKGLLKYGTQPNTETNTGSASMPSGSSPSPNSGSNGYLSPFPSPCSATSTSSDPFPSVHYQRNIPEVPRQTLSNEVVSQPSLNSTSFSSFSKTNISNNEGHKTCAQPEVNGSEKPENFSILGELNPSFLQQRWSCPQPMLAPKQSKEEHPILSHNKDSNYQTTQKTSNRRSGRSCNSILAKENIGNNNNEDDRSTSTTTEKCSSYCSAPYVSEENQYRDDVTLSKVSISALLN